MYRQRRVALTSGMPQIPLSARKAPRPIYRILGVVLIVVIAVTSWGSFRLLSDHDDLDRVAFWCGGGEADRAGTGRAENGERPAFVGVPLLGVEALLRR